jgi:glutathione S-transferase
MKEQTVMGPRYTLAVGTKNWSTWSLRAWLVMKASGAPFTEHYVRLRHTETSDSAKAVSPSGLVPTLTVQDKGDQFVIWDSLAIAEFMAEAHPEAHLWPSDTKMRAVARSVTAEIHSGFADLRKQMSMDLAREIKGVTPTVETQAAIERISSVWGECRSKYGATGPYLFGSFTIADCFYAPVVSRFRSYGVSLSGVPAQYAEALWSHPFVREWASAASKEVAEGLA